MTTCAQTAIDGLGVSVDLIVTRHQGLVEYLKQRYGVEAPVVAHATPSDVLGKVVIGVIPMHLAEYAEMVITIPLHLPASLRSHELTFAQVEKYAGSPRVHVVIDVSSQRLRLDKAG